MFLNTLTADGKYPFQYCENLQLPIENQVSEKGKTFSQIFGPSTSNFKHFEKKMMVIGIVFPKLQTVKNFVTPFCKKPRSETRLDSRQMMTFQENYINQFTQDGSYRSKTLNKAWLLYLEVKLKETTYHCTCHFWRG